LPERAYTDARVLAQGIKQQGGTRNVPSLLNVAYSTSLFWDGRESTLESQAAVPFTNPREMGLRSEIELLARVRRVPVYRHSFKLAYGLDPESIDINSLSIAIAAYERTLLSGDSKFDRYLYGGDSNALSPASIRGLELFRGRAGCTQCHLIGDRSALLTDMQFHLSPTGLPTTTQSELSALVGRLSASLTSRDRRDLNAEISANQNVAALGHFVVTLNAADIGTFRTPSLRNVALTAPYMHDGSVANLDDAIELELYGRDASGNSPVILTRHEKDDLVAFLQSLTGSQFNSTK